MTTKSLSIIPGEDDPLANQLKKYDSEGDWQSLRDGLSQNLLSNDDRSVYFGIIEEEIFKCWPTERTHDIACFSLVLDEWMKHEPNNVNCRPLRAGIGTKFAWYARSASLSLLVRTRCKID